jgi:hypothetical protein
VSHKDELPIEAIRDLLGIARAMYGAAKRAGAPEPELVELKAIGEKLKLSLKLGGRTSPDSVGHRAAWVHAEEATERLVQRISASTPAAPIVEAAAFRVRQLRLDPTPSDEKRLAARRRG